MEIKVLSDTEACEKTRSVFWLHFNGAALGAFALGKCTFRL